MVRRRTSPSCTCGTGETAISKSSATGNPAGRRRSTTWWFVIGTIVGASVVSRESSVPLFVSRQWSGAAEHAQNAQGQPGHVRDQQYADCQDAAHGEGGARYLEHRSFEPIRREQDIQPDEWREVAQFK